MSNTAQSISGVSAINPLVAFYDIHGRKTGAILLFCPGQDTGHFFTYYFELRPCLIKMRYVCVAEILICIYCVVLSKTITNT
jgi:hypothetical protein